MPKGQVFISYSHADADREWIRAFAESLRRHGAQVWLDEFELRAGEPMREMLEAALRKSDVVVSLITAESVKRPNLFFEIGAALGMGKRVVAILPHDLDPSLVPQPLRTRRYLRRESPEETAVELLAEAGAATRPQGKSA